MAHASYILPRYSTPHQSSTPLRKNAALHCMASRRTSLESLQKCNGDVTEAKPSTSETYGTRTMPRLPFRPPRLLIAYHTTRTGIAAGSPVPTELMKQLIEKLNLTELTVAYGMSA